MIFLTNEPRKLKLPSKSIEGNVAWRSPSNIALIKYWGKFGEQLPMNPSLSFTLKKSYTTTTIEYTYSSKKGKSLKLYLGRKRNTGFEEKLMRMIDQRLLQYLPWLDYTQLKIHTENTFPHSAGIASSASAMSAFALCLLSIEEELFQYKFQKNEFYRNASFLARLCSGSACRSIYPGYNLWGSLEEIVDASDAYAVQVNDLVNPFYQSIHDAILIVSSREKHISSTQGHSLMKNHPFAAGRHLQVKENLQMLIKFMQSNVTPEFFRVIENEALSLHGLMMSSNPGYLLLKPRSLDIIEKIYNFRERENIALGFTMDAGPNIHLLYFDKDKKEVRKFIKNELLTFCENNQWIDDKLGPGAQKMKINQY